MIKKLKNILDAYEIMPYVEEANQTI